MPRVPGGNLKAIVGRGQGACRNTCDVVAAKPSRLRLIDEMKKTGPVRQRDNQIDLVDGRTERLFSDGAVDQEDIRFTPRSWDDADSFRVAYAGWSFFSNDAPVKLRYERCLSHQLLLFPDECSGDTIPHKMSIASFGAPCRSRTYSFWFEARYFIR